jgi:hypothetical protein
MAATKIAKASLKAYQPLSYLCFGWKPAQRIVGLVISFNSFFLFLILNLINLDDRA